MALVVQDLAVRGHDRVVRARAARADDRGFHRGAHAELAHAGPRGAHAGAVRALGDARGEAQLRDGRRVVFEPDLDHGLGQITVQALELEARAVDHVATDQLTLPSRALGVLRGQGGDKFWHFQFVERPHLDRELTGQLVEPRLPSRPKLGLGVGPRRIQGGIPGPDEQRRALEGATHEV